MKFSAVCFAVSIALLTAGSQVAVAGSEGHGTHNAQNHSAHGHSHDQLHSGVSEDGTLHIHNAWSRATVKTAKVAGGYLSIANTGDEDDQLIGVRSDASNRVEIHEMKVENDVMQMRPLPSGLVIPAGGEVLLKPGGFHVMFMGLNAPFEKGETVQAILVFEKAGDVEIEFQINSLTAKSADEEHGGHTH